jgi:hypothetical protein
VQALVAASSHVLRPIAAVARASDHADRENDIIAFAEPTFISITSD